MVPVTNPHGGQDGTPGRRGHFACGVAGLGVVLAVFLAGYPAIVAVADGTLGVLSSTSILWLFITGWLVLWLGMDMVLLRWADRRAEA